MACWSNADFQYFLLAADQRTESERRIPTKNTRKIFKDAVKRTLTSDKAERQE